jgi:peptidyl-prolyl cis-trans isomerase SurA
MNLQKILLFVVMIGFLFMVSENLNADENLKSKVIAEVNGEAITFGELDKAYKKNLNRAELDLSKIEHDSLMSFLDLYINYRLKVQDALEQNYDENMEVMEDIRNNRKMLAETFFYDSKLINPKVDRLLEMRKEEFLISVILFQKDPTGDAKKDTDIFNKANKILDSIKNGGDFAYFAKTYSDDKATGGNGGRIPQWITSGRVQKQMEDVVYTLQAGEIYPKLAETNYGYFIIKVDERVPRKFVLGGHILIQKGGEPDSLIVKRFVDSLAKSIRDNKNFAEMAKEHSADTQSGAQGGNFGEFYSRSTGFEKNGRQIMSEVEKAMFALKDGETSEPVKTLIGYHIIKRNETKDAEVENERGAMKKLYKKLYMNDDKRMLLDELKKEFGYEVNNKVMNHLLSSVDNERTNLDSAWDSKIDPGMNDEILFQVQDVKYTLGQFVTEMNRRSDMRGTNLNAAGIKQAIDKIVDPEVFYFATKNLENENQEFADLMREFRDGILLFKVEAERVWDKLQFDSVLAKQYFDTTKQEFIREEMYDLTEVYVLDNNIADSVYLAIKKGADIGALAEEKTVRYGFREKKGNWGEVSTVKNAVAKIIKEKGLKEGEVSRPFEIESGFAVVKLNKIIPSRKKTFEEAIPDLAPVVQDLLQQKLTREWIAELKEKFDVEIYEDVIKETVSEIKDK